MLIRIIFLSLFLYSCSEVHFDNEMPYQSKTSNNFSFNLIGKYIFNDSIVKAKKEVYYNVNCFPKIYLNMDSVQLIKAGLTITENKMFYDVCLKSYFKSNKVDTLKVISNHKKMIKKYEGEFLIFEDNYADTLIDLSKKDKLKYYKGKYYLNHFIELHDWEIFQLVEKKDSILSLNLTNKKDKSVLSNNLIKRYQIFGDIVHLTNEQFYDFVKKGGFRTRYRFKKIGNVSENR